jgi:heme-degrading monooxygenase HmoA
MHAVIFEVELKDGKKEDYLAIATRLREQLVTAKGFISIERFQSLVNEGKLLSLSYWEDEASTFKGVSFFLKPAPTFRRNAQSWKANFDHKEAQLKGRSSIFKDYRICVVKVERDYTMATSTMATSALSSAT